MPRYLVLVYYTASLVYEVEAPNEDTAVTKALDIEEDPEVFKERVFDCIEYSDAFVGEEVQSPR